MPDFFRIPGIVMLAFDVMYMYFVAIQTVYDIKYIILSKNATKKTTPLS